MVALLYLAAVVLAGDALARRWFPNATAPQRWAIAFLVGLPAASWLTYLTAQLFAGAGDRLLLANVISIWWLLLVVLWAWRRSQNTAVRHRTAPATPTERDRWDLVTILGISLLVGWMMSSTYHVENGQLLIASGIWSDFGPTSAIAQSFAVGDNFPTEYPHYAGEPIRYHFLYYFQVGNLTHLGLDPATANNILSVASLVAMLVVVMALGRRLFGSALVGRIGALLFFAHGALSFIPWLAGQGSLERVIATLPDLGSFMNSGFPYRGEEWGIWTQMVFLNQRHLASAIGVLLVIVLFLLERLTVRATVTVPDAAPGAMPAQANVAAQEPAPAQDAGPAQDARPSPDAMPASGHHELEDHDPVLVPAPTLPPTPPVASRPRRRFAPRQTVVDAVRDPALAGYVLFGALAGMLPLWNGSIFIAAAALLGVWLVLFPNRLHMIVLGMSSAVLAVPQLLWVRPGTMAGEQTYPSIYWGYVVNDPTPANVAAYLGFIFGPKLLLVAVALLAASWRQWRVFIAFSSLVGVAFLLQLSVEVLANHKFINAWLVVVNLFAAAGLVRLWRARPVLRIPARLVAAGLALIIAVGGVIDLIPVKNQGMQSFGIDGDPLYEWARTETDPDAVFLTDIYVVHPILLAGRRIYYGWPYYAWSAGYDVGPREAWYRDTFAERSPRALATRLRAEDIDYVAIDDGLRAQTFAPRLNEELFRTYFEEAFVAPNGGNGNLAIYRVPRDAATIEALPEAPEANMYEAGRRGPDALDAPRGLAAERAGTLLVADSGNDRIQRFSSNGNPVEVLGGPGSGPGQFEAPVGVAVDIAGRIWVADAGNRRLQLLAPDGSPIQEVTGPGEGFEALADIDTDNDRVFAVDGATGQVTTVEPDGTTTTWAGAGSGPGQLLAPTGLAAESGIVVVADTGNARVVVFGSDGSYLREWPVPEWQGLDGQAPDVTLDGAGTVWVTSPATDAVLVYRDDGTLVGSLPTAEADALAAPSGITRRQSGSLYVSNAGDDRISLLLQTQP